MHQTFIHLSANQIVKRKNVIMIGKFIIRGENNATFYLNSCFSKFHLNSLFFQKEYRFAL